MSQIKGKAEGGRKSSRANTKLAKCEDCGLKIGTTTPALNCERCNKIWMCTQCLRMSQELYDLLQQDSNLKWLCDDCKKCMADKKDDTKDDSKSSELKELILAMSAQLQTQYQRLETLIQNKVDQREHEELAIRVTALEESQDPINTHEIQQMVEARVAICIDEYREREARKLNLVVHNLPEQDMETPEERKTADIVEMKNVLKEIECDDAVITNMQRLGKKNENTPKPRLALLKMENVAGKRRVLSAAKMLRNSQNQSWKGTFISPDMSPATRKTQQKLRQELRDRKESGEEDLVIRRGQIVKRHREANDIQNEEDDQGGATGGEPRRQ